MICQVLISQIPDAIFQFSMNIMSNYKNNRYN